MDLQAGRSSSISAVLTISGRDLKECPACGQEIPPDKLEEIGGKIASREREQMLVIAAELEKQYAAEKARAENKAKEDLEAERQQSAVRETRARDEAAKAAEKQFNEKLAQAEVTRAAEATTLQRQLAEAQDGKKVAEETLAAHRAEMEELRATSAKEVEAVEVAAKQREQTVREEARRTAEAAFAARITEVERAQAESETARVAAEQTQTALTLQLEEMRQSKDAEIAKVKEEKTAEIARVQLVATQDAEIKFRESLATQQAAVVEANAKRKDAEDKLAAQTKEFSTSMEANLKAQREILDKAKDDAVNAEKARAFEDHQSLSNKVADLQRTVDNKTAEELGEGAEIDLYEALKKEFPTDDIQRIPKGTPGADIIHIVKQGGKKCGTIIYDSKNHNQFRWEHVSKLRADQLAAQAEHAILSTRKFPQGTRQLHLHDGVLLANPARVVLIATMIRQHLLQLDAQRVSDVERESKTAALYEFIVSERCSSLLSRIDERADDLLEEQKKEIRWHQNYWKKQGETIRGIQKAKADLENQIDVIIGTSSKHAAA